MKETKINYYFNNLNEFKHKAIFDNITLIWDAISNINEYLNENIETIGNCIIGENTTIQKNVIIEGPAIIGDNVVIRSGALIREGVIIGDNVVIGHDTEIKHSIIQNNAKIGSFVFCGDSIVGYKSRIGSGTILSNRRFDQKNINIKINNEKYETNLDYLGTIIGDNSRIGANCTCNPGTLIGDYSFIYPTTYISRFIPKSKKIIKKDDIIVLDNEKIELNK